MLGANRGAGYLQTGEWQLSLGYRAQRSHRHYRGIDEQGNRQAAQSEVINNVQLFDMAATFGVNEQCNLTMSLPLVHTRRSQLINGSPIPRDRNLTGAFGVGDVSITSRWWLGNTKRAKRGNVALGIGMKFPTGEAGAQDQFRDAAGNVTTRAIDQSVQPGDGGYGLVLDMQAFRVVGTTTLFASTTYLVNPSTTNGVQTGRGRPEEAIMSVADQYIGRIGATFPISRLRGSKGSSPGMALVLAGRIEGVPVRDLIGNSTGFRRPGYGISVEPGLVYSRGKSSLAVTAPIAVNRNRLRSVADIINGGQTGDASFADYFVLMGYTYRFGR